MNAALLKQAGIDYDAGLARFMNDKALYEAILSAFVKDDIMTRVQAAYQSGDRARLMEVVHEAKGSCGNAGFADIHAEASALLTLLRGEAYSDHELEQSFRRFESTYQRVWNGITAALC